MNEEKKRNLSESVVARLVISFISAIIVAINLNSFVQAGDLFPGGFTGLTRLIMRCAWEFAGVELPFGPINIAINALPALFCLKYVGKNIFTVQYHPEACPGPQDSSYLFDRFLKMMEVND